MSVVDAAHELLLGNPVGGVGDAAHILVVAGAHRNKVGQEFDASPFLLRTATTLCPDTATADARIFYPLRTSLMAICTEE